VDLRLRDGSWLGTDTGNGNHGVRVGVPFRYPWQVSTAGDLVRQARDAENLGVRATRLAVAAEAGAAWIDAAATQASLELLRQQLANADTALHTEEERAAAGLVPPLQLTRMRVERARIASRVREMEAEAARATGPCPGIAPVPSDLEALARSSQSPSEGAEVLLERVKAGSTWRAVEAEGERERLQGELDAVDALGSPRVEVGIQQDAGRNWATLPTTGFLALRVPIPVGRQATAGRDEGEAHADAARALANAGTHDLEARLGADLVAIEACEAWLKDLEPVLATLAEAEHTVSEQYRLRDINGRDLVNVLDQLNRPRMDQVEARRLLVQARLDLALLLEDPAIVPMIRRVLGE